MRCFLQDILRLQHVLLFDRDDFVDNAPQRIKGRPDRVAPVDGGQ
jgi:hypothetical protein